MPFMKSADAMSSALTRAPETFGTVRGFLRSARSDRSPGRSSREPAARFPRLPETRSWCPRRRSRGRTVPGCIVVSWTANSEARPTDPSRASRSRRTRSRTSRARWSRSLLIASADFMTGAKNGENYSGASPGGTGLTQRFRFNNEQGYGRIQLDNALPLATLAGEASAG